MSLLRRCGSLAFVACVAAAFAQPAERPSRFARTDDLPDVIVPPRLAGQSRVETGPAAGGASRVDHSAVEAALRERIGRGDFAWRTAPPRVYVYDPFGAPWALDEALRTEWEWRARERRRAFNERDMAQREQQLLTAHEQAFRGGLARLRAGEYARAVVSLTLASRLNEADPACRIHLAQARVAMGHYEQAAAVLRRGLQLQPRLIYADLHLEAMLPAPEALREQVDALAAHARQRGASAEVQFLLGFMEFQRGDFAAAHAAFSTAARGMPKDDLVRDFLEITMPDVRVARESVR